MFFSADFSPEITGYVVKNKNFGGGDSIQTLVVDGVSRNIIFGGTILGTLKDNEYSFLHKDRLMNNRLKTESGGNLVSDFKFLTIWTNFKAK